MDRMNLSVRTLWALVAVVLMALAVSGQNDCKGKVGSYSYDLSGLAKKLGNAEVSVVDPSGQTYYYKPCGWVSSNIQCQTATDTTPAVCQKDNRGQYNDCGSQSTAKISALPATQGGEGDGFTLTVTGGTDSRLSEIYFKCDQNADPGAFKFVLEPQARTYQFQFATKYACPAGGGNNGNGGGGGDDDGLAGGWIFIIILSSLLVLYLIGGVAYNKFIAHKEGKELIPNVEFWVALPVYVKDGHLFVWHKLRSLTGRGSYEEM